MKKTISTSIIKGLLITLLVGTLVYPALALSGNRQLTAYYNNIMLYIDGAEITPKDANGKVVEPFAVDGTTYLPVRAVAEALGKDVVWDGKTQSVYIGKTDQNQPDEYLDRIQYTDLQNADGCFWVINGNVVDHLQKTYKNGILFITTSQWHKINDDKDNANLLIAYPLNSQYKKLVGKIVLPKSINIVGCNLDNENGSNQTVTVLFYGDNQLLAEIKSVPVTMPFTFDIDIYGVNNLVIKINTSAGGYTNTYVALTDLALYK